MSSDLSFTSRLVGSFDGFCRSRILASSDQRAEVGCVHSAPPGPCRLDELESHRDSDGGGAAFIVRPTERRGVRIPICPGTGHAKGLAPDEYPTGGVTLGDSVAGFRA
jgi:hypothetical protein